MTDDLEMYLTAELATAARYAPRPAGDLLARVEEEHRKRHRHGVVWFAAAASVVLLTAGAPLVIDAAGESPAATPSPALASTEAPATRADKTYQPIEKVWPGAVHVVPAILPNGRPFTPAVFLDDRTVLVRTEKDGNADKMDGLWAYDVKAKTARLLVQVKPPPKTVITAPFVLADRDRLYWWTVRKQERKRIVDIWTAPRAGGAQSRLTTFEGVPGHGGIDLEIVGDKAVWTLWGKGGVFEMPLSGGTPRLLPGTVRVHADRLALGRHSAKRPQEAEQQAGALRRPAQHQDRQAGQGPGQAVRLLRDQLVREGRNRGEPRG